MGSHVLPQARLAKRIEEGTDHGMFPVIDDG